ncbi:hypothetical protein C1X75_10565 [Pseudomonas sp. FW305-17]|nr:hypothetical protein C1X79_08395 [Pseudomonas sp. FW305-42]PNA23595.1 hypothetical protein C1X78_13120 [Pseudomonas sp. MPR-R1B]PNB26257.1 hypothetical protein C1X80_10880 [Pseudomonas sp. DP16D-E2]PNB43444.1 hypothetical protein C1X75_10565 [Pseudomonas sp. FW305-17]PNB61807.1 hypothetical protein C1X77_11150 [Pseudomonas sp. GW531-E2]PNB66049.1 hypothetical protein C1X76_20575 [Pseudomonas sp. FW305-127]
MSARRPDKAKRGEEAQCTGVHEHSEPRFNAVWASADTFRTEPRLAYITCIRGRGPCADSGKSTWHCSTPTSVPRCSTT